ncbi:hypothetical protein Pmar_PMAR014888 [Perkinsus marinus ATCC 50983]|uniref:Uncharacterized protein n=1 Tax=Perkinsus marinus (strain ATCC 50983 / TXsc) TaxID=423536 RepID=C5L565_PERM5|nr:hypothetical protein Pmar_PMAR014888 [Perkinsus marinus ATCC 50983]EER08124.1 hypothetical protein Pmar_PMAR014888 [Perkinsus marinus ATCC 50983]|eukprot:XP_002776308.1 hypothetical protein Pmar_PMAR014888 [Perkinsus marinus ATCC 50983]
MFLIQQPASAVISRTTNKYGHTDHHSYKSDVPLQYLHSAGQRGWSHFQLPQLNKGGFQENTNLGIKANKAISKGLRLPSGSTSSQSSHVIVDMPMMSPSSISHTKTGRRHSINKKHRCAVCQGIQSSNVNPSLKVHIGTLPTKHIDRTPLPEDASVSPFDEEFPILQSHKMSNVNPHLTVSIGSLPSKKIGSAPIQEDFAVSPFDDMWDMLTDQKTLIQSNVNKNLRVRSNTFPTVHADSTPLDEDNTVSPFDEEWPIPADENRLQHVMTSNVNPTLPVAHSTLPTKKIDMRPLPEDDSVSPFDEHFPLPSSYWESNVNPTLRAKDGTMPTKKCDTRPLPEDMSESPFDEDFPHLQGYCQSNVNPDLTVNIGTFPTKNVDYSSLPEDPTVSPFDESFPHLQDVDVPSQTWMQSNVNPSLRARVGSFPAAEHIDTTPLPEDTTVSPFEEEFPRFMGQESIHDFRSYSPFEEEFNSIANWPVARKRSESFNKQRRVTQVKQGLKETLIRLGSIDKYDFVKATHWHLDKQTQPHEEIDQTATTMPTDWLTAVGVTPLAQAPGHTAFPRMTPKATDIQPPKGTGRIGTTGVITSQPSYIASHLESARRQHQQPSGV